MAETPKTPVVTEAPKAEPNAALNQAISDGVANKLNAGELRIVPMDPVEKILAAASEIEFTENPPTQIRPGLNAIPGFRHDAYETMMWNSVATDNAMPAGWKPVRAEHPEFWKNGKVPTEAKLCIHPDGYIHQDNDANARMLARPREHFWKTQAGKALTAVAEASNRNHVGVQPGKGEGETAKEYALPHSQH